MAKLELKNLNKTYNTKVIPVRDISLTVDDNEFLTLLGPSGCGKSTTLRLIAGLEQPTRGQILIGDRDVTYARPGDRNISMVFQSYALYPHMTVQENLAAGLKLQHVPPAEVQRRIAEVASFLGLDNSLMQRKPAQLSGGQRQRVAVGRALVRRPDVFLLDEPLSNLDALLREHVRADLKELFAEQRVPVVYVTHDQTEAMTLSTKVAVLNNGLVQQLDPPHRIYNQPANQFVAGFVGSPQMNLLTLRCQARAAYLGEFELQLPTGAVSPPGYVVMGIRPEHIRLSQAGETPTVRGQVRLVENLGMHNLVTICIPNGDGKPFSLRVLLPPDRTWSDRDVSLTLPPESLHWFDAETGDALFRQGSPTTRTALRV